VTRALAREPRRITGPMLLAIHATQVERYGGAHGVIDANVVLAALARPVHKWHDEESSDLADLTAAYLYGFGASQGFRDGNKRTALACALVFLDMNGMELDASGAELYALTMGVATGQAEEGEVARWFRARLS
jgi:death-on-curing protein